MTLPLWSEPALRYIYSKTDSSDRVEALFYKRNTQIEQMFGIKFRITEKERGLRRRSLLPPSKLLPENMTFPAPITGGLSNRRDILLTLRDAMRLILMTATGIMVGTEILKSTINFTLLPAMRHSRYLKISALFSSINR